MLKSKKTKRQSAACRQSKRPPAGQFLRRAFALAACGLVSAVAEETEHVEEQVDEVKIERQRADCGDFAHLRRVAVLHHLFDFLGVPCGEADEDCHAGKRNQPFKGAAAHEDVDNRRDNQADKRHKQERAHFCKVVAGQIAVDAHSAKHACRYGKGVGYRTEFKSPEYRREHHAVEHGVKAEFNLQMQQNSD